MYSKGTCCNQVGLLQGRLHFQKANEFKSGIWVEKDDRRVNAKSLLGVLSLGIILGATITILPKDLMRNKQSTPL